MRKLIVCIGVVFIILLTACTRQDIQTNLKYDEIRSESNCLSDENFLNNQNNLIDKKDIHFSFSSTLNVFMFDNAKIPLENKVKINRDEVLALTLMVNVTPDETMPMSNIPLRIWVIVDGQPVKLSLYEFNDYCISQDVFVDASINQFVNISFPVRKQDKTITIVCNFFPELIPELGVEFSGGISYTIINENSMSNLISIDNDNYYLNVEKNKKIMV